MKVGIVGAETAKFSEKSTKVAKALIADLVRGADLVVSGGCHLGGVDKWAEEAAKKAGIPTLVHKPRVLSWSAGYKPRNIQIAEDADVVYNIVVADYPVGYHGMRFGLCYHCKTNQHVKSGGCWTAHYAHRLGKPTKWFVVDDNGWWPFDPITQVQLAL
jgi:hypothetical protein